MTETRIEERPLRAIAGYFLELARDQPRRILAALGLMLAVSFTEGLGVVLLIPLLSRVGVQVGQGSLDAVTELLFSLISVFNIPPTLGNLLLIFVVVVGSRLALVRLESVLYMRVEQEFAMNVLERLHSAIMALPLAVFSRYRLSDLTHLMTSETGRYVSATSQLLRMIGTTLVGAVYLAAALAISASLTVVAGVSGILLLMFLRRFNQRARNSGEELSTAGMGVYRAIHDHLGGYRTIKSYGLEGVHRRLFSAATRGLVEANIRAAQARADFSALYGFGSILLLASLVYAAVEVFGLSSGGLLLLLLLFTRLVPRFSSLQSSYHTLVMAMPAVQRVSLLIADLEKEGEELPNHRGSSVLSDSIVFENVSFTYPEGAGETRFSIEDLNLIIPARSTVALLGPSGSGKSTVADLLIGLLEPDRGRILLDGSELSGDLLGMWRSRIGYVPQDPFLFHESIRANLTWAAPAGSSPDLEAALGAAAAEFVYSLPNGVETVVGDRGVLLSGGERQRIALARALIREPDVLVLDEATSAVDTVNEGKIQEAIKRLHGHTTVVLITHDIASVREADLIYVFAAGKVVQVGTWDELVRDREGQFHALLAATNA